MAVVWEYSGRGRRQAEGARPPWRPRAPVFASLTHHSLCLFEPDPEHSYELMLREKPLDDSPAGFPSRCRRQ